MSSTDENSPDLRFYVRSDFIRAGSAYENPDWPNGSAPGQKHDETSRCRVQYRDGRNTQTLPSHLFWTWFVDNPRSVSGSS